MLNYQWVEPTIAAAKDGKPVLWVHWHLNLTILSWVYPKMFSDSIMASWYFEVTHPLFW